ncbi:MAG: patatin-like phospholipase family protein [Ginsengibacter sp.]
MSVWGPLQQRYETSQKRKMLALDGGGIRGVLTLEILAEMEKQLRQKLNKGDDFVLGDYFDYIGGTSTGAIIAAGLSIGMSVQELLDFYVTKGKDMFDKNFILKRWKALYESGPLLEMLKQTFGEDTDLMVRKGKYKSLLLVVTMNRSTDSPWPISNNPLAKFNDESLPDCNSRIKLFQLVRASTAAPVYFPPETIQWDPNDPEKSFVFVDGGVTPYNNPAFLMYRMATQSAYNLNWATGEDKLLIISVGTGSATSAGSYDNLLEAAKGLPNNLMYAMQVDQDINCRTIGRCTYGSNIDLELRYMVPMDGEGNIVPLTSDTKRHFLYARYNADLSRRGLDDIGLKDIDSDHVREMDSVLYIDQLRQVGRKAANQISMDHFGSFV